MKSLFYPCAECKTIFEFEESDIIKEKDEWSPEERSGECPICNNKNKLYPNYY